MSDGRRGADGGQVLALRALPQPLQAPVAAAADTQVESCQAVPQCQHGGARLGAARHLQHPLQALWHRAWRRLPSFHHLRQKRRNRAA